ARLVDEQAEPSRSVPVVIVRDEVAERRTRREAVYLEARVRDLHAGAPRVLSDVLRAAVARPVVVRRRRVTEPVVLNVVVVVSLSQHRVPERPLEVTHLEVVARVGVQPDLLAGDRVLITPHVDATEEERTVVSAPVVRLRPLARAADAGQRQV